MKLRCPNCNKQLNVPDTARGKRGRCPSCKEVFVLEPPEQEPQRPEPIGLADDSGDYNPFLDALNRDAEKAQPAGRQDAEAQGDWAGASGSAPAASGPVAGSGDWASAGPAQPAPTGGRKKKKRGASPSRSDSAAGPSSLSENPALRIATLVCACLIGVGLFLPWFDAEDENMEFITIKAGWLMPAVASMASQADEGGFALTSLALGLFVYCLGTIAAVIVALMSLRDWDMSRVFVPGLTAALGVLLFLIGMAAAPSKAELEHSPLAYIFFTITIAATVLAGLQVNWRGVGAAVSRIGQQPAQPVQPTSQFSSTVQRGANSNLGISPIAIAALILGLAAISPIFYSWAKDGKGKRATTRSAGLVSASLLGLMESDAPEKDDLPDQLRDKYDALKSGRRASWCMSIGATLFFAGMAGAVIASLVSVSMGSWSFRFTGIGGAVGLFGMLLFVAGWAWFKSATKELAGGDEDAVKNMGLAVMFYVGAVQVVAMTAVGFMSD
jgi:phage FluMu protein Com